MKTVSEYIAGNRYLYPWFGVWGIINDEMAHCKFRIKHEFKEYKASITVD